MCESDESDILGLKVFMIGAKYEFLGFILKRKCCLKQVPKDKRWLSFFLQNSGSGGDTSDRAMAFSLGRRGSNLGTDLVFSSEFLSIQSQWVWGFL